MTDRIQYDVAIPNPDDHLVHVTVRFVAPAGSPRLCMPVWTPGSYLVREFGRHVQDVEARADGEPVRASKQDKATWAVDAPAGAAIEVRFKIYAHELSVRTPHVDGSHAFLTGTAIFPFVAGLEQLPVRVRLAPPPGWAVHTTLPSPEDRTWEARDYDHLADAFFELGPDHDRLTFEAAGATHEVVVWGRGNYDRQALARDMARVVEQNASLFGGGVPYARYLFVVHLADQGQGGLEHADCTALLWQRHRFKEKDYDDFLRLVAHEHFHVWNVKRIRPAALGPFDYLAENYTRALWAMEGITSYYDDFQVARAGLVTPARYLELVAERIQRLEAVPGRRVSSLEEASLDAWIKLYRPNEHSANAHVSYYLLGGLVTLALDLEIRRASAGAKSFDDVMRGLWQHWLETGAGLPDDAFKARIGAVGGDAVRALVRAYIEERREIDWNHHLEAVGLRLARESEAERPWLGITRRDQGDRVFVASVLSDGPSAGAGLYPGDELAAINGWQVKPGTWKNVLALLPVEGEVEVAVFRREQLVVTTARTRPEPGKPKIEPVDEPSADQLARRREWLGAEL